MSEDKNVVPLILSDGRNASVDESESLKPSSAGASVSYGGGGNGVDSDQKDYIDARVEAVRAQNDARFAEILAKLNHLPSSASLAGMLVAAVVTTVGLLVGVLAFGGDRFDGGVQVSAVSVQQAVEARQIARQNAEQVKALNAKMDTLIEVIRGKINQ